MGVRTIISALEWGALELKNAGKPSPRLDAEVLLASLMGIARLKVYLNFDRPIDDDEARAYVSMIKRRLAGEPVAYITGRKEFFSREFVVGPGILVPRPETECMVEAALKAFPASESANALDLCCGSGNIAITIAAEAPALSVTGTDVSQTAVEISKNNAEALGVSEKTAFLKGDLFEPVSGRTFDLIISNPPYIPSEMIGSLQVEIAKYEPREALDGGDDGLAVIKRIVAVAHQYMTQEAWMFVEIGDWMADEVRAMVGSNTALCSFDLGNDLSGRPRYFTARRS